MKYSNRKLQNGPDFKDIGRVFTPLSWAKWALNTFGVYRKWREGASIIDPTCGQGVFIQALIELSIDESRVPDQSELKRIAGVEVNPQDRKIFLELVARKYRIKFPEENFQTLNYLQFKPTQKFDLAVGNPPWINFTDLDDLHKEYLKHEFVKYGLVANRKDALLGSSRVDLASLIIHKCMRDDTIDGAEGYFFVPMSLLFNEGANKNFGSRSGKDGIFAITEIYDFEPNPVFKNTTTRNGFVILKKGCEQKNPIPLYKMQSDGEIEKLNCFPSTDGGAWMRKEINTNLKLPKIKVGRDQIPRQGINTCGLNKVFILERQVCDEVPKSKVEVFVNGYGEKVRLSTQNVFPLIDSQSLGGKNQGKRKHILCLHGKSGKPLNDSDIQPMVGVAKYLQKYKAEMSSRKGVLIQSHVNRGKYWALLGVGSYCFSRYKVVWASFGKKKFKALVFDGTLQGNQAMHAFIPCDTKADAIRICRELNKTVPNYLDLFGMEGTCNWAQPGRIKRLLTQSR